MKNKALQTVINTLGGPVAVARFFEIQYGAVQKWQKKGYAPKARINELYREYRRLADGVKKEDLGRRE